MIKYFHANNANRPSIPKFHLYEYCGSWMGVLATESEAVQKILESTPAVTEITEEEYNKCLAKASNLPEEMRPRGVKIAFPKAADTVTPAPVLLTHVATAEDVLQPMKVATVAEGFKPKQTRVPPPPNKGKKNAANAPIIEPPAE